MEQHPLGEIVWGIDLRELQVNHLDSNNLSMFYDALEYAINEVLENYDVEIR
jgi:hypothetical protein